MHVAYLGCSPGIPYGLPTLPGIIPELRAGVAPKLNKAGVIVHRVKALALHITYPDSNS